MLWGAQRETREDERTGVKRVMTWAEFATTFRLLDDKGKLYGEMSTGNPGMRNDYPERLIAEFPPQTVLGQYELDPGPGDGERHGDAGRASARTRRAAATSTPSTAGSSRSRTTGG